MSIYATLWSTYPDDHGFDDGGVRCAKWKQVAKGSPQWEHARLITFVGKRYRLDSKTPCSCGAGTLPYYGSHVLPSDEDKADGGLEVAAIPGYIERVGREDEKPLDDDTPWPYLRLCVDFGENNAAIVLTEKHVTELYDALTYWLEARGVIPT